ncbi:hypothetical protein BJ138DRAFT_158063 [Hygrophoropsis aurantiaca]|uniref:Uncharacterized protein n=1 Tax=Hygrophoropsis aurantiaca TaxID=72124 RepID=A0ACB8AAD1_9AGAM|nr:hypothetical protein BJ138DRAFT_158063 [Hygrophoropsis aurantiaca]
MPTESGPEEIPCSTLYDVPNEDTSIVSFLCDSINPSCTREGSGEGRSHPQPLAFLAVVLHKHGVRRGMRTIYKINLAGDVFPTLCPSNQAGNPGHCTQMVLSPRLLAIYDPVTLLQEAILMDVETHQLYELPDNERELIQTHGVHYDFTFIPLP